MKNVISLNAKREAKENEANLRLPADIRNLKTMVEAVKEAEAKAQVSATVDTGAVLNNLYAALLCQIEAVVENAETAARKQEKAA